MKLPLSEKASLELVRSLIQQTSGIPANRIGLHDSLIIDLEMDSVELIDLLMQLEDNGVVLHESQINMELTVGRLAQCFMVKV